MQQPQDTSISDFLRTVESGQDIKGALLDWQRRNSGRLKVAKLREDLFSEEPQERQSSGNLRSTAVLKAIETEKRERKKRLGKIRLEKIPVFDDETVLIPVSSFMQNGYHVVIERGRTFSLKIYDSKSSTLELMKVLSERCYTMRGCYPSCIFINISRFLALPESVYQLKHFFTRDGLERIPFDCAEDGADYDVMVVHDEIASEDVWTKDRQY